MMYIFIQRLKEHFWISLILSFTFMLSASLTAWAIPPQNGPLTSEPTYEAEVSASNITVTPTPTTLSTESTLEVTMTLSGTLPSGGDLMISSSTQSGPPEMGYSFDMSNATIAHNDLEINSNSGPESQDGPDNSSSIQLRVKDGHTLSGTVTLTLENITNPSQPGVYNFMVSLMDPQNPSEGQPPSYDSDPVILGTASIQGTVKLPNGTPVGGVWIDATSDNKGGFYGASTDENGQYIIFGLDNGSYRLSTFLPSDNQELAAYVAPEPAQVSYTGSTLTKNFTLTKASSTIKATVYYAGTTTPVTEAQVMAFKGQGPGAQCNVNSSGKCSLSVSNGNWEVMVNAPWNENGQVAVDWSYSQPPKSVEVTDQTKSVTFYVDKASAIIQGTILTENGSCPDNSMQIHIDARNKEGGGGGGGVERDCSFRFNVPAGTYQLTAWLGDGSQYYLPESEITVKEDATATAKLVLKEMNSRICGKVTDANGGSLSGIRMNLWKTRGEGWTNATTNSNGQYCAYVYPGEWEIMPDNYNSSYVYSGPPVRAEITTENQTSTGNNFELVATNATITCNIVDENGERVSDVWGWCYARSTAGFSEFGTGLGGGQEPQIHLVDGNYRVGAWIDPNSGYLPGDEQNITVSDGDALTVNIEVLPTDSTISGYLLDYDTGEPVTGQFGWVFAMSEENFTNMGTEIREDGSYRLDVRSGNRYMMGFHLERGSEYLSGGGPEGTIISVSEPGNIVHNFSAERANATIIATVLDIDGSPLPYAFVGCENWKYLKQEGFSPSPEMKGERFLEGEADGNGIARIAAVDGQFDCTAFSGNKLSESSRISPDFVPVNLNDGDEAQITLQFKKADGQLSGSVTNPDGTATQFGFVHAWSPNGGFSGAEVFGGSYSMPLSKGSWYVGADSMSLNREFYNSPEVQITFNGDTSQNFSLEEFAYGPVPEPKSFSFDNSSSGTTLKVDDYTTLIIPSQALGSECSSAQVTASPNVNLYRMPGSFPLAYGWDFDALCSGQAVTSFNSTVTLRLCYKEEILVGEGIDEDSLSAELFDPNTNAWTSTTSTQNSDTNCMDLSLNHFSTYSINSTTGGTTTAAAVLSGGQQDIVASPMSNGGPQVALWDSEGNMQSSWMAYNPALRMGMEVKVYDIDSDGEEEVITIPTGEGFDPHIRIFSKDGTLINQFDAYPGFRRGVNMDIMDLDGDGYANFVTVPAANAPAHVKIFSYDGNLLGQFPGYDTNYTGGALVSLGDVDADGMGEIILASANRSSHVRVFSNTGQLESHFFAYGSGYDYGVATLTLNNVQGTSAKEIITTPRAGGSHVRIFNSDGSLVSDFHPYSSSFRGGSRIAVGDVDNDGQKEILALPQSDGSAHARIFAVDGTLEYQFFAYPPETTRKSQFNAVIADFDGNGSNEIAFGPGSELGPHVRIMDYMGNVSSQFMALHPGFRGGLLLTNIDAN